MRPRIFSGAIWLGCSLSNQAYASERAGESVEPARSSPDAASVDETSVNGDDLPAMGSLAEPALGQPDRAEQEQGPTLPSPRSTRR